MVQELSMKRDHLKGQHHHLNTLPTASPLLPPREVISLSMFPCSVMSVSSLESPLRHRSIQCQDEGLLFQTPTHTQSESPRNCSSSSLYVLTILNG